uniref:Putative ovule protein n=1 Tax=Solanum chacoense TaxID=4108 RepID=A0A0V0GNY8_SOLCH
MPSDLFFKSFVYGTQMLLFLLSALLLHAFSLIYSDWLFSPCLLESEIQSFCQLHMYFLSN